MRGKIIGEVLLALIHPDILIAPRLRDDLHPAEKGRGAIDKRSGAIERIRHDTVHADARMVHLELLQQAQSQLLFGGIARIGWGFREALRFGDTLLFEGLEHPFNAGHPAPSMTCRKSLATLPWHRQLVDLTTHSRTDRETTA